jgi:glycerol uptake facilitator-like aquaporin
VYVALVLSETTAVSYFIATSVAVALGVAYMFFSSISGGHFNPAITFGMWTARAVTTVRGVSYIVAQLLGGLGAWKLYEYFTNHSLATKNVHYSTAILLAELVGTAVLAMGYSAAVARAFTALEAALTIGASLFVGVLIAATASAGYLNPAVALGSRSFNAAYILGPLLGGLIGVTLYNWLFVGVTPKVVRRIKK